MLVIKIGKFIALFLILMGILYKSADQNFRQLIIFWELFLPGAILYLIFLNIERRSRQ